MKPGVKRYLDAYVAARRLERQAAREDAAWERWAARARLADSLGDEGLAELARRRALLLGEAAVQLRLAQTEQDRTTEQLKALAQADP